MTVWSVSLRSPSIGSTVTFVNATGVDCARSGGASNALSASTNTASRVDFERIEGADIGGLQR